MSWGNRNRQHRQPKEPASIGDTHVENACSLINNTMLRAANLMVPYSPSREAVLPMLFADDTLIKLQAVRGMVNTTYQWKKYRVAPGVDLSIDFRDALVPTIEPEFLCVQPERASPLLNAIEEIRAIYLQYEKVKHVLRWMNRNATAGAVRHYWPTALQLCRESPALANLTNTPTRFATPRNIGEMLQLIRDTSATMSASAMLPSDAETRAMRALALRFMSQPGDGVDTFRTDEVLVNF